MKISKKTLAATLLMAMAITAAPVRSNAGTQSCVLSSGQWLNSKLSQVETGSFRLTYDATAASTTQNAVTGLSAAGISVYPDFAVSLRFNQTGSFDARNGGAYEAASLIPYKAGVTYHFIVDVNITSHTYSSYVVVNGVTLTIGKNFAFRTEQAAVKSLAYLGAVTTNGSHTVCNITVGVPGIAPAITTQPSSRAITAGQTASFSVATTGTAPMSYQCKKRTV